MVNKKIIIIGIDGGDLKVINPLIKKGLLPNVKNIIEKGSLAILESSILPSSEQAWASFSTGCNNGKHGLYSYIQRPDNSYRFKLVDGSFFKGKRLWDVLGEHDKKSIIINVTATYPPKKINGVLVSCRLTPNKKVEYTYPESIKKEIEKIAPNYITRIPRPIYSETDTKKMFSYADDVYKKIVEQGKITRHLMKKYKWDLFVLVFDYTDDIQHVFWKDFIEKNSKYSQVIPKLYEVIDNEIGRILSEIEESPIIVLMSDHGFGPLKRRINFNVWLKEEGYFFQNQMGLNNLKKEIFRKAYKLIPHKIQKYIKNHFFSNVFSSIAYSNVDWARTKAFSVGSGGIQINLKGREAEGVVSNEDYEKIREELINKLRKLKDPKTGLKAIKKVYKREEVYHGPYLKDAPDIVNLLEDGYKPDLFRTNDSVFSDEWIGTGNHSFYGFFAIEGSGIKKLRHKRAFNIIDITPTILHLMGIPIPEHIDGRVLKEVLK